MSIVHKTKMILDYSDKFSRMITFPKSEKKIAELSRARWEVAFSRFLKNSRCQLIAVFVDVMDGQWFSEER